jgi:hypothetical protein
VLTKNKKIICSYDIDLEAGIARSYLAKGVQRRVVSRDKLPLGWAEAEQPSHATPTTDVDAKKETIPGSITHNTQEEKPLE